MRNRPGLLGIALVVLTTALVFSAQRSSTIALEDKRNVSPTPKPQPTQPDPADMALAKSVDALIDGTDLKQARWGVSVISAKDERTIYARDADKLFMPASNMKVYTTAVALDLLGGDYHWRTSVYANRQPDAEGVIDGDLTLYGRGAPDLRSKPKGDAPTLSKFADQLYQSGVREVRGNIIGDESYFRGELFGLGWQWNDLQWYFGAEPSALTIDENSVEVTMGPGTRVGEAASVVITPNQNFIHLTNNAATRERDAVTSVGINRDLSDNDVRVWGEFPVSGRAFSAFISVHNPALWAATLFKQALIARGIKVDGEPRSRDFRIAERDKFDPQKSVELVYQESESLSEIVHQANKESNNLFAELILRTVGKERGAAAPDPDPRKNKVRGDDEAGTAIIRSWLESKGIATHALSIRDGSGLSRLDLITPETTARLLTAISKSTSATVFHDSLPIAGRDGTLSDRLKKIEGRIFAKTGTLTYVHALSGFATTPKGETLVFSIMCNDATSDRPALALVDQIATAIADYGKPASSK